LLDGRFSAPRANSGKRSLSHRLQPDLDEHYVTKVSDLRNYLNKENARREATQILRSLVDEIRLHTIDGKLQIELIGDLAALLSEAIRAKHAEENPVN